MAENRNDRLSADYLEMLNIQDRPYLSWIATKGEPPYTEEYLLTVKVRTYVLSARSNRYVVSAVDRCTVLVSLRDSYPLVAPYIRMLSLPPVFHPDWYSKGTYCASESWRPECSLKDYILRMIGTLCYDPELMNTVTPANYKALDWYLKNKDDPALFPSDRTELTENSADEAATLERAAEDIGEPVDSWGIG